MVRSNHYDVVIRNGRVMDPETLFGDVCNVGIRGGRIVDISQLLRSSPTFDDGRRPRPRS